ncbi:UNKNOWN [Stylonychia lemnae]|uniref:Uncharacterized protein n=1 Tax=Stylonychia lemnae TaxID=5949 RepID=A0A078AQE5_STYLE|nr:UNKNOWN [Stylonychia lemnae]|eukprot:CDW84645.1 UNKNOWN [Stylonychia lemnae]
MIILQLLNSLGLFLASTLCKNSAQAIETQQEDVRVFSLLPHKVASNLRNLHYNVDNLMRDIEDKFGSHFKIFKLFWEILERNTFMLEKKENKDLLEPIRLFADLNKLKFYKDNLLKMIKQARAITVDVHPYLENDDDPNIRLFEEDNLRSYQQIRAFDEIKFLDQCEQQNLRIDISEIEFYIDEFECLCQEVKLIKSLTEQDLLPIYDTMTQLFDDQIEEYIERKETGLSMRELQAFYKIRTKILHSKISELNQLVENQNEDIRGTRGQYTDELLTLKDEVSELRQLQSHLEVLQQSADYYMTNGTNYGHNNNFMQDYEGNSFEKNIQLRASEATKSLYDKAKTKAIHQKNKLSTHSKGNGTQRVQLTQTSQTNLKNLVKKRSRKNSKNYDSTRQYVRSSTDDMTQNNKLQINCFDSRPTSQLSGGRGSLNLDNQPTTVNNSNRNSNLAINQYGYRNQNNSQNPFYSIEKELQRGKLGQVLIDQPMLENFFTQSPIHGSAAPKNKGQMFTSIDDFIRESAVNTNYNSQKKNENDDNYQQEEDDYIQDYNNPVMVTDFQTETRNSPVNNKMPKITLNSCEDQFGTFETTQYSTQNNNQRPSTNYMQLQRINELFGSDEQHNIHNDVMNNLNSDRSHRQIKSTVDEDIVDLLNNRPPSSSSQNDLERNMYLNESIDKIEERNNEDDADIDDNYDICTENYDIGFGHSNRTPNDKIVSVPHLKKMVSDRMTPEFKLNSDDFIKRDSRANSSSINEDGISPRLEGNHPQMSNMKKRIVRAFTVEEDIRD